MSIPGKHPVSPVEQLSEAWQTGERIDWPGPPNPLYHFPIDLGPTDHPTIRKQQANILKQFSLHHLQPASDPGLLQRRDAEAMAFQQRFPVGDPLAAETTGTVIKKPPFGSGSWSLAHTSI
jgi:hypothetical protein